MPQKNVKGSEIENKKGVIFRVSEQKSLDNKKGLFFLSDLDGSTGIVSSHSCRTKGVAPGN